MNNNQITIQRARRTAAANTAKSSSGKRSSCGLLTKSFGDAPARSARRTAATSPFITAIATLLSIIGASAFIACEGILFLVCREMAFLLYVLFLFRNIFVFKYPYNRGFYCNEELKRKLICTNSKNSVAHTLAETIANWQKGATRRAISLRSRESRTCTNQIYILVLWIYINSPFDFFVPCCLWRVWYSTLRCAQKICTTKGEFFCRSCLPNWIFCKKKNCKR